MMRGSIAIALLATTCEAPQPPSAAPTPDAPAVATTAAPAAPPAAPAEQPATPAWTPIRLVPVGSPGFMVRPEPTTFGPQLTLPEILAYDVMYDGAAVAISLRGVHIGELTAARIEKGRLVVDDLQGHLLPRLLEPLTARRIELEAEAAARKEESFGSVVLFVERSTPFATLVDVLYTANRAGFREYQIAIDVGVDGLDVGTSLTLSPPKFAVTKKKKIATPGLKAFVQHDRVLLSRDGRRVADLPFDHHDASDLAALAELAREQAKRLALPRKTHATVILSADGDISIQRVMTVYSQMTGPDCAPSNALAFDRTKCFFPQRVIEAGASE
jgi:biopolymer transport protein ExbD